MTVPIDQAWAEATLLAIVRMTAFLFIAPPFSYNAFPARIKAMLGVGLGLAVSTRAHCAYTSRGDAAFITGTILPIDGGVLAK